MRLPPPTARTRSGTGSGSDIDETQSPNATQLATATTSAGYSALFQRPDGRAVLGTDLDGKGQRSKR